MPVELMLVLGLVGIFAAIAILLTTIGTITSERQAVTRSLAAVQAMQTSPASMQAELNKPFSERVLSPENFVSTVYAKLGMDPNKIYYTPEGRPVHLVSDPTPIRELMG